MFLLAKLYKPGFDVIENCQLCGDKDDPLNTIPKELQVFEDMIVHMYMLTLSKCLDWHQDLMRLDNISSGKYVTLINGSGLLEVKSDDLSTIESFELTEKYKWIKFERRNFHRFTPYERTTAVMASTLHESNFDAIKKELYYGTKTNAGYPQLLNNEELEKLKDIKKKLNYS